MNIDIGNYGVVAGGVVELGGGGGVEEWRSVKWWSGGVVEWWNGGVEEWWCGVVHWWGYVGGVGCWWGAGGGFLVRLLHQQVPLSLPEPSPPP